MKTVIKQILDVDKKILLFLIVICIIGVITGSIFITVLDVNDKNSIITSLDTFIKNIGHFNSNNGFVNNLIINIIYILIIWIMGISIIGLPIVIFIIFLKSFLISFTISSFILKYKTKGLLLGIIYNIPHHIVNIIIYIYLGVYAAKMSLSIIDSVLHKKNIQLRTLVNKYLFLLGISFILILFTTIYETYLMPILLKKLVPII